MTTELCEMTNPLRTMIASTIVTTARPNPELRERLARELSMQGFEDMTVDEIADMAISYGVTDEAIAKLVETHANEWSMLVGRYLCRECLDHRLVPVGDGFAKCPSCNRVKVDEPFDPKATK